MRGSHHLAISARTAVMDRAAAQRARSCCTSVYRMPVAHFRARAVLTNTLPTNPYRSAGRPEAIYRDGAADRSRRASRSAIDRIDIRRRNLIPPKELPYANPLGMTYDNGDYDRGDGHARSRSPTGRASPSASASRASARQAARHRARQLHRDAPAADPREWSKITVKPEGRSRSRSARCRAARATRRASRNASANGSACRSTSIKLVQGDTDIVPVGGGSHSGRSMRIGGDRHGQCSDAIIDKAKRSPATCWRPSRTTSRSRTAASP